MDDLILTRPDDWHVHFRNGEAMAAVVPFTARQMGRAIVMPNLVPPITTTAMAQAYRQRIMAAIPAGVKFEPLMTLYLTNSTCADEIQTAYDSGIVKAVKLYPAGATTNSQSGVTAIEKTFPALAKMQELGMPLLTHGEVVKADVDIFDREARFITDVLSVITSNFPRLKIVCEHITTRQMAEYVAQAPEHIAATVTPQHLLYNRNAMLVGGIKPHFYCLPILKRESHRQALIELATSGFKRIFLGTDTAPHPVSCKESACGCAGVFSAPHALELYAQAFEDAKALDKLEAFASFHGADFYGLPRNTDKVRLVRQDWTLPESYDFGDGLIKPIKAGEIIHWKLQPIEN